MNEMPQLRHPFIFQLTQMIGANKINQNGDAEFDDMPQFSRNIIGEGTVRKQKIKKGIENNDDNKTTNPSASLTFVQVHGLI